MSEALTALEAALARGAALVEFDGAMRALVARRGLIDKALRRAIALGELSLVYQPLTSFDEQRVIGVEALVRWRSGTLGHVAPAEFLPIAEATGYIERLGEWILDRAFYEYMTFPVVSLQRPRLCLNVSGRQLRARNFYELIVATAARYAMLLTDLEIELNEAALLDDTHGTGVRIIQALRDLGARDIVRQLRDRSELAYGTAPSSARYRKNRPHVRFEIGRAHV